MTTLLPDEVQTEADGAVRIISLNRPDQFNAVTPTLHRGLLDAWRGLEDDTEARAVVLTGRGRAFCAGGDMGTFAEVRTDAELRRRHLRLSRALVDAMLACPLPVVAAVNGPAVGLGCSLAVLCDLVVMDEGAYMADPHVAVGLVAGDGGAATWPLMMSLLKAKEFIFTGARIPAVEAERLGLANRVVATGTALSEALALAHQLAALPPQALQETKRALNVHLQKAIIDVLPFALATESESFTTPQHAERVAAFSSRGR